MVSKSGVFLALIAVCSIEFTHAQIRAYEESLTRLEKAKTDENLQDIGGHLRGVARYNQPPESSPYYRRIQQAILSIPGHAEFYAKPVWESYSAYRDPNHPKHECSATWFGTEARYGLETLKHLPSPGTVKVLGGMLREEWIEESEEEPQNGNSVLRPSRLAYHATWTLADLPLRNMPSPPFERYQAKDYLPAWQEWYEQIKSGQRTFSFKGQAVEYRFNPDGTWQTIPIANPPDDAPKPPVFEKTESKPERQAKELEKSVETKKPIWVWMVTTGLLVVGILLWLLTKRRPSNGNV
jgi:hypothetical protein